MVILTLLIVIIFPLTVHHFKWKKEKEKIEKTFTETSIKYIISIFLSIPTSIAIALKADISPSSNHGGFIYIIGPAIFGIIVLLGYISSLPFFPKKKIIFGILSILINLGVGIYFMLSDF